MIKFNITSYHSFRVDDGFAVAWVFHVWQKIYVTIHVRRISKQICSSKRYKASALPTPPAAFTTVDNVFVRTCVCVWAVRTCFLRDGWLLPQRWRHGPPRYFRIPLHWYFVCSSMWFANSTHHSSGNGLWKESCIYIAVLWNLLTQITYPAWQGGPRRPLRVLLWLRMHVKRDMRMQSFFVESIPKHMTYTYDDIMQGIFRIYRTQNFHLKHMKNVSRVIPRCVRPTPGEW